MGYFWSPRGLARSECKEGRTKPLARSISINGNFSIVNFSTRWPSGTNSYLPFAEKQVEDNGISHEDRLHCPMVSRPVGKFYPPPDHFHDRSGTYRRDSCPIPIRRNDPARIRCPLRPPVQNHLWLYDPSRQMGPPPQGRRAVGRFVVVLAAPDGSTS